MDVLTKNQCWEQDVVGENYLRGVHLDGFVG